MDRLRRGLWRWLCLCLAVLLTGQLLSVRGNAAPEGVYFTVADRVVMPMEDASMPFQQDGQWYVPHTVFTQRELDVPTAARWTGRRPIL